MQISPIQEILADFKRGQFVVMIDHKDRENEGDLMLAAEFADAERINFMLTHARGLVCLTLTAHQVYQLKLPFIKSEHHSSNSNHAAFTFSIEAKNGIKTGISARERAHTIQTAIRKEASPQDIVCPGHVFPLAAKDGGVLVRAGHTEASVDLAQLSQLNPSAVICEILNEQGEAAGNQQLFEFAKKHGFKIGTVDDLVAYRKTIQAGL